MFFNLYQLAELDDIAGDIHLACEHNVLPALITWAVAIAALVFVGKRVKIKRGWKLFKRREKDE